MFTCLGYADQNPTPVLLDLHGLGLDGDAERLLSGFEALCDEHGFIGVWPTAPTGAWRYDINEPPHGYPVHTEISSTTSGASPTSTGAGYMWSAFP